MADDNIEEVLTICAHPEAAARDLVTRARARGSHDDITAVVVELAEW